jgi:5-methylcytosine-specific restriction endonuclease McrA
MTIEEAIRTTDSMRAASASCDIPYSTFIRKAKKLGLYEPNQGRKGKPRPEESNYKFPLSEVLEGKHPVVQTWKLKNRMLREGLIENKCDACGIKDSWQGKPIAIHMDHINGIHNDHRLENLQMLCPNCHSQTSTYCGKNKGINS